MKPFASYVLIMGAFFALGCGTAADRSPEGGETAVATAPIVTPALEGVALTRYTEELASFWRDYEASLRRDDGWLSLVGLHWLDPGANACGGNPNLPVALPAERAPPSVGTFELAEGVVAFTPAADVAVMLDGAPVDGRVMLATDADGAPSLLGLGSLEWHVIIRGDRHGVRVKDRAHSALASFAGIETFQTDLAWRVRARFEAYDPPRTLAIPTVLGTELEVEAPGAVVFERDGAIHRLDAIDAGDELWLIFGDATNGPTTYGGGRFLYTPKPDADGTVLIDFNRATNPPCAYSVFATCPLPPPGNKVTVAIEAGEILPPGGAAHS